MATTLRPFFVSPRATDRGAQCPNCFTYNLLDHLPATKKRAAGEHGWDVQCALCGSQFHLGNEHKPAAA
jgi:DNA-directed RNA polymerase subunit RPC12/RpoP